MLQCICLLFQKLKKKLKKIFWGDWLKREESELVFLLDHSMSYT